MLLLELLLNVLGEGLIQLICEGIAEFFLRTESRPEHSAAPLRPAIAITVYFLAGALIGWVTVAVYPHRVFAAPRFPGASLVISPILTGGVMAYLGKRRPSTTSRTFRLDRFSYGFAFALGISAVRFVLLPE